MTARSDCFGKTFMAAENVKFDLLNWFCSEQNFVLNLSAYLFLCLVTLRTFSLESLIELQSACINSNINIKHFGAVTMLTMEKSCWNPFACHMPPTFSSLPLSLMASIVGRTQHALGTEIKSFPLSTVAAKELWCNSWQQLKSNRNESHWITEERREQPMDAAVRSILNCQSINVHWLIDGRAGVKGRGELRVHVTGKQNRFLDTLFSAPYDCQGNCSRK